MKYLVKVNFFNIVPGDEPGFFKIDGVTPYEGDLPPFYGDCYSCKEIGYYIDIDLAPVLKIGGRKFFLNHYLYKKAVMIEDIHTGWPICEVWFEEDESYPKLTVK
jgi:hypothetical protein